MKLFKNMTKAEIRVAIVEIVDDLGSISKTFRPFVNKYENMLFPDVHCLELQNDLRNHYLELVQLEGKIMYVFGDEVNVKKEEEGGS